MDVHRLVYPLDKTRDGSDQPPEEDMRNNSICSFTAATSTPTPTTFQRARLTGKPAAKKPAPTKAAPKKPTIITETQDIEDWKREILVAPAPVEAAWLSQLSQAGTQEDPIDLCELDTQQREWIDDYSGR
jgi:hypothetical protein